MPLASHFNVRSDMLRGSQLATTVAAVAVIVVAAVVEVELLLLAAAAAAARSADAFLPLAGAFTTFFGGIVALLSTRLMVLIVENISAIDPLDKEEKKRREDTKFDEILLIYNWANKAAFSSI
ncbi:hypothetical protein BHYA_0076g00160 [Botrytis hyacinthi]|uniref:Uncharacterized protein n=1 Tax=Botrytis hyacinthi TaxID=278943 RepID=A0A4Z1GNR2_9HELO|nr:hypothetical protein BHYA_0076g00160 [Botrytis hyacinthi]